MAHFQKTPVQQQALRLLSGKSRFVLLFGGSRSGKTFILLYSLLIRALKAPGSRHIILRFHGNAVRQSVMLDTLPKVIRLAFPGLHYHCDRTDQCIRLPNGSELWFAGLDTDEHLDKILGKEFATIFFNECSEISYNAVNTALSRLAQKTSLVNRAWFDCNPAGKSHWSYRLFIRRLDPESGQPLAFPENYASMLMNPDSNRINLPPNYLEETLAGLPERQRLRFLAGQWLDDLSGALWNSEMLIRSRVGSAPELLDRVVIGIDPAVTSHRASDETGIIVVAKSGKFYYVLEDLSCQCRPSGWAETVCRAAAKWHADRVTAEVNNGGDLVGELLHSFCPELSYKPVRAIHGKLTRAEPAAALYEQNLVRHVGSFPVLEEQMTSFTADSTDSPDRLDALVWALHTLSQEAAGPRFFLG